MTGCTGAQPDIHRLLGHNADCVVDEPLDTDCVDGDGEVWPEHNFNEVECVRCGAEPDYPEEDGTE